MAVELLRKVVDVVKGHLYGGTLVGARGPVDMYDGDTVDAPLVVRMRDNKRTFFWAPAGESGPRELLLTGWPGLKAVSLTVLDMGVNKQPITSLAVE